MAEIYRLFTSLIGETLTDYDDANLNYLRFLDAGIDKASQVLGLIVDEEIEIEQSDIDTGYIELTHDIVSIIDTTLNPLKEDVHWQTDGTNKILFIKSEWIFPNTYKVTYKTKYKIFDGEMREDEYFDFPKPIDLGIVFWALSVYMETKGLTTVDGETLVQSKSEEGMSVSYDNSSSYRVSSPRQLRERAIEIFRNSSNSSNINFSITI
jgi:hypothetical protein